MSTQSTDDPIIQAYKRDIDRSLLRENLKLTVEQRFLKAEAFMEFARGIAGVAKRRPPPTSK